MLKHPFQILKQRFHYGEVPYRGIAKNLVKLEIVFALAKVILAEGSPQL